MTELNYLCIPGKTISQYNVNLLHRKDGQQFFVRMPANKVFFILKHVSIFNKEVTSEKDGASFLSTGLRLNQAIEIVDPMDENKVIATTNTLMLHLPKVPYQHCYYIFNSKDGKYSSYCITNRQGPIVSSRVYHLTTRPLTIVTFFRIRRLGRKECPFRGQGSDSTLPCNSEVAPRRLPRSPMASGLDEDAKRSNVMKAFCYFVQSFRRPCPGFFKFRFYKNKINEIFGCVCAMASLFKFYVSSICN